LVRFNNFTTVLLLINTNFSFSEIFYIDATNEQTLQADLKAITSGSVEWSVDACWHWLGSQGGRNWVLLFDNADDMELNLRKFIPSFGNTLITTRNPQICTYVGEDANSSVGGLHFEDSKALLLYLSQVALSDENKELAGLIVTVCSISTFFLKQNNNNKNQIIGPSPLSSGSLPSRWFYQEFLIIEAVSTTLSKYT